MGFDTDLVAGVAQLLATASIGLTWHADGTPYAANEIGLYDSEVPATPDDAVTVSTYGLGDDAVYADSIRGLQIRSRRAGADPRPARDLDDLVADTLLGLFPTTLPTGIRIVTLVRTSGTTLGQDDNLRWTQLSNFTLELYRPGPHRL